MSIDLNNMSKEELTKLIKDAEKHSRQSKHAV